MKEGRAKHVIQRMMRRSGYELVDASRLLPGHLMTLIQRLHIDAVLDVGACHGEFGSMLREAGYEGPIISFEPVASNYAALERRTGTDPLWTTYPIALGALEEQRRISVSRSTDFSSFLPMTSFGTGLPWGTETTHVEDAHVVPLEHIFDDILPEGCARPLLKTDTQGWDLAVLRGAGTALGRVKAVQVEMSATPIYEGAPTFMETMEFLLDQGYELTGLFPPMSEDLRLIEFDCVMARLAPRG